MDHDPYQLMFGDLDKLAPGSDAHTREVLASLPRRSFARVVDAGCGTGRQTRVLARELDAVIDAVDTHQPFLDTLVRRAEAAGCGERIRVHCVDMATIPERFAPIDLLWAEGSAYSIGFDRALALWAPAVRPGGYVVVSELCWLTDAPPAEVREFFASEYPAMGSLEDAERAATEAGFTCVSRSILPPEVWTEGFYDLLGPRARELSEHDDGVVRELAGEMLREIATFERSQGSYGYVFLVLRRPPEAE